jgi:hypothetical protein
MGTALTSLQIGSSYSGLLKTTDNAVFNGTLRTITDGMGNDSALQVSTAGVNSTGTLAAAGGYNGTVGAGTPAAGAFTTVTASGQGTFGSVGRAFIRQTVGGDVELGGLAGSNTTDILTDNVKVASFTPTGLDVTGAIEATGDATIGGDGEVDGALTVGGRISVGSHPPGPGPGLGDITGSPGMMTWDEDYLYVCVDTDLWKRVAISAFYS